MTLIRPSYSQLLDNSKKFDIYFLASGGKDSTAMVLEAYRLGIKGTMIFNDTFYNRRHALDVLKRLEEITGFPLRVMKYDGKQRPGDILRTSFQNIPRTIELMKRTKRYNKKYFYCCRELKHNPTTRFLKSLENPRNALVLMGSKRLMVLRIEECD
jgi:3'-phosphoadenosine 5'-phosphosulfate sulfotransferase (PAPS reductase)/FAD synthetase